MARRRLVGPHSRVGELALFCSDMLVNKGRSHKEQGLAMVGAMADGGGGRIRGLMGGI